MNDNQAHNSQPPAKHVFTGQSGLSLIETMFSVAISGMLALIVAMLVILSAQQFQLLVAKTKVQEGLMMVAYQMRNILGQAQDLSVTPGPILDLSIDLSSTSGLILNTFDSTAIDSTKCPGARNCLQTLAYFLREAGLGDRPGTAGSHVVPSAIFFQAPTVGSPGRIYIDVGSGAVAGGPGIGPRLDNLWFDNIVELKMETLANLGNAKSAKITIKSRYYLDPTESQWVWCPTDPATQLPNCPAIGGRYVAFKDIQMSIDVGFRNNILNTVSAAGGTNPDRLFGNLFFFKTFTPLRQ